jgi:MFS family permease
VTTIVFIISIPIALAIGRASDRLGARKPFLMFTACVIAVGLVVMALLPEWTSAVVGYGLYAIGTAIFLGLHSAYAMQILPSPEHRGRDLGILNLTNTLPALLGPSLTWALATTERFTPALLTLAVLTLIGGALVLPVRSER